MKRLMEYYRLKLIHQQQHLVTSFIILVRPDLPVLQTVLFGYLMQLRVTHNYIYRSADRTSSTSGRDFIRAAWQMSLQPLQIWVNPLIFLSNEVIVVPLLYIRVSRQSSCLCHRIGRVDNRQGSTLTQLQHTVYRGRQRVTAQQIDRLVKIIIFAG